MNVPRAPSPRLLLIGPEPPPAHGTSVKFEIFRDFARHRLGTERVQVIDTQTGDKAVTPLFGASSIRGYIRILTRTLYHAPPADVIVIFGSQRFATLFGLLFVIPCRMMGKRVYISFFGGAYDLFLGGLSGPARRVVTGVLSFCSGMIMETRHLKRTLEGVWPGKVHYVPNFRRATPAGGKGSGGRRGVIFLYSGVIRREKGMGELLEAFRRLDRIAREGRLPSPLRLDLYGPIYDGPGDRVDLQAAAGSLPVRLHGEIPHDQLLRAYAEADAFVYPSYWPSEGHSGSVIEALSSGLPVIAAEWRATPELVQDGRNGLLCPPRDADGLAACMERVAVDAGLRRRLAEGAARSAREYDAEKVCDRLLDIVSGSSEPSGGTGRPAARPGTPDPFPGRIHWWQGGTLLASRGRKLYSSRNGGRTWEGVLQLPVSLEAGLKSLTPLARRFFRQDVHHLIPMDGPVVAAFAFGSIFVCDLTRGRVISGPAPIRGSRPMRVCRTPDGSLYYGEYWGERRRGPVNIYGSDDQGRSWRPVYRLEGVRHVHGVYHDPYADSLWVTTGDRDEESAFWVTDDRFQTLQRVVGGSQQTRAVQLLFTEDFVYFASDSPHQRNYICRLDRRSARIERLQEVGSSVFYGTQAGGQLFFSTVAEASRVNETKQVVVWRSPNGEDWGRFAQFEKDLWPRKMFQYGQVHFPMGPGDGRHLWLTPYSCRGDQVSLCYDLESERE